MKKEICIWKQDAFEIYHTQCKNIHYFDLGNLNEWKLDGFIYCPFCGMEIEEEK